METRLRIKYGKKIPALSAQQILNCGYMGEGCDGGWALFNGYFLEQAYVVADKCMPYTAKTKGRKCGEASKCPAIAKVANASFIGGGYGMNTELNLM